MYKTPVFFIILALFDDTIMFLKINRPYLKFYKPRYYFRTYSLKAISKYWKFYAYILIVNSSVVKGLYYGADLSPYVLNSLFLSSIAYFSFPYP